MVTDREGHARVDYPEALSLDRALDISVTSANKPLARNFHIQSRSISCGTVGHSGKLSLVHWFARTLAERDTQRVKWQLMSSDQLP